MAKQTINVGTSINDGTGDPLRTALTKTNANFDELYSGSGSYTAAVTVAVTFASTITLDGNTGINFKTTLTGAITLANPINMRTGQSGVIILTQDATGGRIITYGSNWKFPGGATTSGVLSTAANAIDMISYYVRSDGTILCGLAKAFS